MSTPSTSATHSTPAPESTDPRDAAWVDPALVAQIRSDLLDHPGPLTEAAVAAAVRRSGRVLGSAALPELVARLTAQLSGAGPLQPLLDRPGVTDVFVNGPRDVWADFGDGLVPVPLSLGAESDVRALAVRLAASGGRRLDDSSPLVDVRLPDGIRVNAVIPPLSGEVTVLSFRIPRPLAFGLEDLVRDGFIPAPLVTLIAEAVSRRANLLISGGTGSGKTVLLGAMLSAAPSATASSSSRTPASWPSPTRTSCSCPPGRRTSRVWARYRSPLLCAMPCGCDRTGWSWARSAVRRSATCSPPSTPATRAGAPRSTRTRARPCPPGSRHSERSRA